MLEIWMLISPNVSREKEHQHTMCLRAISSDFFEIVLPKPVLSVAAADFIGLRVPASDTTDFRISGGLVWCPLFCDKTFGGFSGNLLRGTMGKDSLRFGVTEATVSEFELEFDRTVSAAPGRILPAEADRSGNFVLRLGGVSSGKSGRSTGRTGARDRGLGELGRDEGAEFRPLLAESRPTDGERPVVGATVGATGWRVGVDGLEFKRATEEFEFEIELAGIRGREVGVDDLELGEGADFSPGELGVARVLTGVGERVGMGREVGVDGLAIAVERAAARLPGFDGLEVTEAELVLRTDVLLVLEKLLEEMEGRVTEPLLAGLVEWPFSD